MFAGITALAMAAHVHIADNPAHLVGAPAGYEQRTVIAQLARRRLRHHSPLFYAVQAFTAAILVLAANTAFNGFPILASILGGDGYLPRQFSPPRRPAGVLQRHRRARRPRRAADLGVRRLAPPA